jgi:MYXO-CTERM domain-containing protein
VDLRRGLRRLPGACLGLGLGAVVGGNLAVAGNEAHVRTPVLWPSECATIVDRSVDPVAHFDYAIPVEDTLLTADELPDSRTHQFVGLCRDRPPTELLPAWITRDDAERSYAAGLTDDPSLESGAILDESAAWSGCFVRVTGDDQRRPITFEQAALGVDWDTSAVAAGVWSVAGYTFEPAFNLWRQRPGFVKIVDDRDDPEQDLPAIALLGGEQLVDPGTLIPFDACVDLLGPGTIALEWAEFRPQLDWHPLTSVSVDTDGPVAIEALAPIAAAEQTLLIRARLTDARGRERLAYLPSPIAVAPCPAQGCSEPEPSEPAPELESHSCAVSDDTRAPGTAFLLVVLLAHRSRRRDSRERA